MSDWSIEFRGVSKQYFVNRPVEGGFKNLVLHLPSQVKAWRRRQPFDALIDVSFRVARGECLAVIGPNGAGKSTTLGLAAGVLRPTRGTVETRGRICPLLELGAGFHGELNGHENIELNGVLLGLTRREVARRAAEIIDFAELGPHVDAPLRTYSSGMIARLGFAVAVHMDPDILLIDEVLSVGDERFRQKCLWRIQQFRERNTSILLVSHDLQNVAQVSDRVAWIEAGRLRAIGPAAEVIDRYRRLAQAA